MMVILEHRICLFFCTSRIPSQHYRRCICPDNIKKVIDCNVVASAAGEPYRTSYGVHLLRDV